MPNSDPRIPDLAGEDPLRTRHRLATLPHTAVGGVGSRVGITLGPRFREETVARQLWPRRSSRQGREADHEFDMRFVQTVADLLLQLTGLILDVHDIHLRLNQPCRLWLLR